MRQSERGKCRARGPVIRVKNASDPQTFRDLDEYRGVFDIDDLLGRRLGECSFTPPFIADGYLLSGFFLVSASMKLWFRSTDGTYK